MDFSKKNLNKGRIISENGDSKIGSITNFAFSENRELDW